MTIVHIAIALAVIAFFINSKAVAQEVYFGVADQWDQLIIDDGGWREVRDSIDGFYVNFIMLNRITEKKYRFGDQQLLKTCGILSSKKFFLESDIRSPPAGKLGSGGSGAQDGASSDQDQQYIRMIEASGCNVVYSSLNYGWSAQRYNVLQSYMANKSVGRKSLVQVGGWTINGDIGGPSASNHIRLNETIRTNIESSDGVNIDCPIGLWVVNKSNIRRANLTLIKFARTISKRSAILISPYPAGQERFYNPSADFLRYAKDLVHYHEDNRAVPDIWVVFEYATDLTATPEAINATPFNSSSGVAFWLLRHLRDPQGHLSISEIRKAKEILSTNNALFELKNSSTSVDFTPIIKVRPAIELVKFLKISIDGVDITTEALSAAGATLSNNLRLNPNTSRQLTIGIGGAGQLPASLGKLTSSLEVRASSSDPNFRRLTFYLP